MIRRFLMDGLMVEQTESVSGEWREVDRLSLHDYQLIVDGTVEWSRYMKGQDIIITVASGTELQVSHPDHGRDTLTLDEGGLYRIALVDEPPDHDAAEDP